jgi:hypothetical protein
MPDAIFLRNPCIKSAEVARDDWDRHHRKVLEEDVPVPMWQAYGERKDRDVDREKDARVQALVDALEKFDRMDGGKYRRSSAQRQFHKHFIGASLKKIYGDDLLRNMGHLKRKYGFDDIRQDVVVLTPRQFGKTTATEQYVAAWITTQPETIVSIYSTGRRAARKLLAGVWKWVCKLVGRQVLKTFNQETLEIYGPGGIVNFCNSYPAKEDIGTNGETPYIPPTAHVDIYVASVRVFTSHTRSDFPRPSSRPIP